MSTESSGGHWERLLLLLLLLLLLWIVSRSEGKRSEEWKWEQVHFRRPLDTDTERRNGKVRTDIRRYSIPQRAKVNLDE